MKKRCVIIGSGIGGLSTGLVLSRAGFEVTVLEQSNQIGGCLQCFSRNGAKFETGMHIVGSLDEGQVLSNYLNFLGVKDKIVFSRLDPQAYDVVSLHGEHFAFPNGHEAMVEHFGARFPKEKDNLVRYWKMVEGIAEATPYYNLKAIDKEVTGDIYSATHSINKVLDTTIGDPLLREVLMGQIVLYAANRDRTPFALHAFITDFYNRSAFRIVGGSDSIAHALSEEIIRLGGEVRVFSRVTHIRCDEGVVKSVELDNGETLTADLFISDIHPASLVTLFDEKVLRPAYIKRLQSIPNTTSVFSLFVKFKPGSLPYLNSNFYGYHDGGPWDIEHQTEANWPRGYLYMHRCHELQPQFADTGVMFAFMSPSELLQWQQSRVEHRGSDYEAFKLRKAAILLSRVEDDFPGISECIESQYTATPLTYRDYMSTPDGAIYGIVKDITLGVGGRISYRTKLPNLFLVGQNIKAHGILGVLVSTIEVCQAILGESWVRMEMLDRNAQALTVHIDTPTRPTALIMGGGLGGLISGALLTKNGYRVTVLEKNHRPGGGLLCFRRNGFNYPTGMHISGGFQPGGQLEKLCAWLGILDSLHLQDTTKDSFDEVVNLKGNVHYRLPKGREAFTHYLCQCFPDQEQQIHNYIEALYRLSQEEDLFYLRPDTHSPLEHSEEFLWPVDRFIAHYISNPKLQMLLSYLVPLCGGVANQTPAYIHALINILHIEGATQFIGGSQQLADALAGLIEAGGGKVCCGEQVEAFDVADRCITAVQTHKGRRYDADIYVSDLPVTELVRIAPKGAFPKAFRQRMDEAPCVNSVFKVYLQIESERVLFHHSTTYSTKGLYDIWTPFADGQEAWPQMMMCVAHPDATSRYVETVTLISPMPFDWVRPWESTTVGCRGMDYVQWKAQKTQKLLDFLRQLQPEWIPHVVAVEASSPLTIRDYYGNKEGSTYGLQKDCHNMMQTQLSVYTKLSNLFLTGQNVNLHGLCGVALTAISTVEAILGDSHLRCRIADFDASKGNPNATFPV